MTDSKNIIVSGDVKNSFLNTGDINLFLTVINRGTSLSYQARIKRLIESYLGSSSSQIPFGGRLKEMDQLNYWINSNDSNKLLFTANAGRGKTALLIHWLQQLSQENLEIVFIPISIRYSTNSPLVFYEAFANRMSNLFNEIIPAATYDPVNYFKEKVIEYIYKIENSEKNVLIVIDGLDEATGWKFDEVILPKDSKNNLKIILSARLYGNKSTRDWADQVGWDIDLITTLTVNPIEKEGIKDIFIRLNNEISWFSENEKLISELFRLTEGDPLLLQLYITDLSKEKKNNSNLTIDSLSALEPGFKAYFQRWMAEQKIYSEAHDINFNEETVKTLLAVFACALGPLLKKDLESLLSEYLKVIKFLDPETLQPIERFLIGDGIEIGYSLCHPQFGFFLQNHYFSNLKRIDETKEAYKIWGLNTIEKLNNETLLPEESSSYLLQYFSQHLKDTNSSLESFEKLICNGWRKAQLRTDLKHIGFAKEISLVWSVAEEFYKMGKINSLKFISISIRCSIFLSSIQELGTNLPNELHYYAIKNNVLTPGQVIKQIEYRTYENRLGLLFSIAEFLPDEILETLVNELENLTDSTRKINLYTHLAQKAKGKYQKIALEKLKQLPPDPNINLNFNTFKVLAELHEGEESMHFASLALELLPFIPDPGGRAMDRAEISRIISKEFFESNIETILNEFLSISKDQRLSNLMVHSAVKLGEDCPIIFLQKILEVSTAFIEESKGKIGSFSDHFILEALINSYFALCGMIWLIGDRNKITEEWKLAIENFDKIGPDYYCVSGLIKLAKFTRGLYRQEVTKKALIFAEDLPKANNRTHHISDLLVTLEPVNQKIAVLKAMENSELIEDHYQIVKTYISLAKATQDNNRKNQFLNTAVKFVNNHYSTRNEVDILIDVAKVLDGPLKEEFIEKILKKISGNFPLEDKLFRYERISKHFMKNITEVHFNDIVQASFKIAQNPPHHVSWLSLNIIYPLLKPGARKKIFDAAIASANQFNIQSQRLSYLFHLFPSLDKKQKIQLMKTNFPVLLALEHSYEKLSSLEIILKDNVITDISEQFLEYVNGMGKLSERINGLIIFIEIKGLQGNEILFQECMKLIKNLENNEEKFHSYQKIINIKNIDKENIIRELLILAEIISEIKLKNEIYVFIAKNLENTNLEITELLYDKALEFSDVDHQKKILECIIKYLPDDKKIISWNTIFIAFSKHPRSNTLSDITGKIPQLYEFGGEDLIDIISETILEAVEWWP